MKDLRRLYIESGTYFFTVVTNKQRDLLCKQEARLALRTAVNDVRSAHPFDIIAWVLLPDHLHCIWTLPSDDADFSIRWSLIKRSVSYQLKDTFDTRSDRTVKQVKRREAGFWQHRFWEHAIKDENDLIRHFDYVHFNPVKHGLVEKPSDWEWSTFHKYLRMGYYDAERMPADEDVAGE